MSAEILLCTFCYNCSRSHCFSVCLTASSLRMTLSTVKDCY